MDEFLTDEEQADRTKRWLRENGLFIAAGVVLGLGTLFGWQRWEDYQLEQSGQASIVWEQLGDAVAGDRYNEVQQTLEILETEYAATPYLDQARLAIAKYHMDRNEADLALQELQAIVSGAGDTQLRRIAELRMAQIYVYLERLDEALAILGAADDSPYAAQFHELRGDVYFARNELEDARDEYRKALEMDIYSTIDRSFVQMKLDDVNGSIALLPVGVDSTEVTPAAEETE